MRVLGLIGGMSWESTALYYRQINEGVKQRLGGLHSARILLDSLDFASITALQREGRWDEAGKLLADRAVMLERAGVDCIALCTNTMHKVAPAIEARIQVPLLHIADVTAQAVKRAGLTRVGLLGTSFTMEQEFYRGRLHEQHGLAVIVPSSNHRAAINQIIFEELCLGVATESSREKYRAVMAELVAQGAQAILFACTEIGMLVSEGDMTVPVFDTTRIHTAALTQFALES